MIKNEKCWISLQLFTFVLFFVFDKLSCTFTTNVKTNFKANNNVVKVGNLTTFTCMISSFDPSQKNYSVQFFSRRDGLIATYEVQSK